MKKLLAAFIVMLIMIFVNACVRSQKDNGEVEAKLKATLMAYLSEKKQGAQQYLQYEIKSVQFFEENEPKPMYLCEFNIHMHADTLINNKLIDTEGVMKFRISKDFKILSRDY